MATRDEQIGQLEAAIAAQEALRPALGDAVVELTLATLRAQREALRAGGAEPARGEPTSAEKLARLQSYLPGELAEKMRATGRIESERKQVTVLFADIAGFTAMSERLDPEEMTALADETLRELAEAVYQHEGYIDKFVGDGLMAVFGAPVAHEDDPGRALRAALAMRERIEDFNRRRADRLAEPLALHTGVNTGPVIAGNVGSDLRLSYTVMGDTVNTASRLEDASAPRQILVSRDTYRLTREAFTFVALDPISVKGKREPLTVFELERARLHPGKGRGLKDLGSAFVGREREVARLGEVLAELVAGRGRIVTIVGEAGIGKSRLMAEWRSEVGDRASWLEGPAFAHTTTLAYGPFLALFRRYARIDDDDSEVAARDRLHAAVEQVFPGNAEAHALFANLFALRLSPEEVALLADFPAEALRRRLFALIEALFERLAAERPTLLVLEDMHWADASSLELVQHLLPLTGRLPLAIVAVFRPHPDEVRRKLQAAVDTIDAAERSVEVSLQPLSGSSSLRMVEQLLARSELPDRLREMIVGRAEGNPFFVEEVIRSLIERGALVRAESGEGWVATGLIDSVAVPDTLQGVLMSRLDRLPDETKRVAQQAAVIGRVFLYRVLLRLSEQGAGVDVDLSHLEREELIRQRMRDPEVSYIFKHALTQEIAYQSLLGSRRKELHRRVGEAMVAVFAERLGEFRSIIGEHFLRGEAWAEAADHLIEAGDAAARLFAHPEARLHYAEALEALTRLPETDETNRRRVDTTIKLVGVSFGADKPEEYRARLAQIESVAQALPAPDGRPGPDRLRLARVHFWIGRAHYYRNEPREAIRYYRDVLAVAQEFGDWELAAIPASTLGQVTLLVQGQYGKAEPLLRRAVEALERVGDWPEWTMALGYLAMALAARGAYVEALAEGERALLRAREMNNLRSIGVTHLVLSGVCRLGGDSGEMLAHSCAAIAAAEKSGDWLDVYVGFGLRAWAESRLGRHEAATASMARSKEVGQRLGGGLILSDVFTAAEAEIALHAGRVEDALVLAEAAVAAATTVGNLFAEGLAHCTWGRALVALDPPRWDEAVAHLAASLQALDSGGDRLDAARTHLAWGQLCRDRGDVDGAREHLGQAAAQFEASDLPAELERARSMLAGVS